jgi:Bacterial regulatory protein, Fis family
VPRSFGHARSRVSTLNRVLARQEKEIIETALEECYGQVSGPSGAATKLGLPARTLDSKIKRFKINKYRFKVAKGQLILSPLKEKPPEGWSSLSPLTVLTPSKPRLILARIVGIKIDVQARYSAISKLEDVAETAARSFAPSP